MMWQNLLIVFLLVSQSQAFNVDIYEPIVRGSLQNGDFDFNDSAVNKDMFGYRVALYNSTVGPRFIVGAPRGSVVGVMRPNERVGLYNLSYGVVYNCPVDQGDCVGFGNGALYDNTANGLREQKNGQLMGATIKVRDNGILVCAPRFIRSNGEDRFAFGACYRNYSREISASFSLLAPEVDGDTICESTALSSGSIDHLSTAACTAGVSGDIRGNVDPIANGTDLTARISVGIPGNVNWQGTLAVYTPFYAGGRYRTYIESERFDVPSTLFGYNMVYYRANKTNSETDPNTVVSAPRAIMSRGLIRFYITTDQIISPFIQSISGPMVGNNFGASLAAVDFNGDGFDEVVVGAPTYSENGNPNIGQIFVYTNFTKEFTLFRTINGMEPNAQFGYALVGLGDIDRNGFEDFAVGAPFGTGSGVVYIFSGVGGNELIRQTQVIIGSELSNLLLSPPRSFGFSFSNGFDVDGNGYPDFAVGSYLSQRVYLFRSRPVANMTLSFNFSSDFLNLDETPCMRNGMMYSCIDISACFNYSGMSVEDTLDINYEFVIERRDQENSPFSRGFFRNDASIVTGTRTLMIGVISCVTDVIHFRNNADEFTPIPVEFFMSLEPVVVGDTNGNSSLASLSSRPVLRVIESNRTLIPLIRDCGPDARCIPDLMISGTNRFQYEVNGVVDNAIETISTGVVTAVLIPIELVNNGIESALGPTITFDLPQGTGFIRAFDTEAQLAQICTETDVNNMTRVECDMGFSIQPSERRVYSFRIQTREITGSEGTFSIAFIANNSLNEDIRPMDNSYIASFNVTAEADVFIQSSFRPDSVPIGRSDADISMIEEASELGPAVQGQFVVRNSGPSPIPTLQLEIFWPSMAESSNESFLLYPSRIIRDSADVECNEADIDPLDFNNNTNSRQKRQSNENQMIDCAAQRAACVTVTCTISNLRANESSTIRIEGFVHDATFMDSTTLMTFRAFSRVTIVTDYITQPTNEQSNDDIATLMGIPPNLSTSGSNDGVEAWVIIVPIIVAIIIIVVAVISLYFFGFFKRKKVDKGDEIDLATWQSPNNGENKESSPATGDPTT